MAWQDIFQRLVTEFEREDFDVTEEKELDGTVWIRKDLRATAKVLDTVSSEAGVYFKFITPPIENYEYEPVFVKDLTGTFFIFRTTNPPVGGGFTVEIGANGNWGIPIEIGEGTEFLEMDDITFGPYLPQTNIDGNNLIYLRFKFDNTLTSSGSNHHILFK